MCITNNELLLTFQSSTTRIFFRTSDKLKKFFQAFCFTVRTFFMSSHFLHQNLLCLQFCSLKRWPLQQNLLQTEFSARDFTFFLPCRSSRVLFSRSETFGYLLLKVFRTESTILLAVIHPLLNSTKHSKHIVFQKFRLVCYALLFETRKSRNGIFESCFSARQPV